MKPPENPYQRPEPRGRGGRFDLPYLGHRPDDGLTLHDVDQVIRHRVREARAQAVDAAELAAERELPKLQAEAYERGWQEGYELAAREMREQYGIEMHRAHLDPALARAEAAIDNDRDVRAGRCRGHLTTITELRATVAQAAVAIESIEKTHASGLKTPRQRGVQEIPF